MSSWVSQPIYVCVFAHEKMSAVKKSLYFYYDLTSCQMLNLHTLSGLTCQM